MEEFEIEVITGNTFSFTFQNANDRWLVLHGGLWSFDKAILVLEESMGKGDIKGMCFNKVAFWIQIHNVPLICMTAEIGRFLGEMVDEVKEVDTRKSGDCVGKFIRVRVVVQVDKPLRHILRVFCQRREGYRHEVCSDMQGILGPPPTVISRPVSMQTGTGNKSGQVRRNLNDSFIVEDLITIKFDSLKCSQPLEILIEVVVEAGKSETGGLSRHVSGQVLELFDGRGLGKNQVDNHAAGRSNMAVNDMKVDRGLVGVPVLGSGERVVTKNQNGPKVGKWKSSLDMAGLVSRIHDCTYQLQRLYKKSRNHAIIEIA
ncbi:hypothetical protein EZV62_014910 [Acer yangbiense]|uniref:Uncharacterized protein n=1 Tax=Acer yangbiense TaxID=1000413 RepID=A0A5C7HTA1_9ROSI|nr:hypothetical protein EZV62_014910 [Acer yangbiense]